MITAESTIEEAIVGAVVEGLTKSSVLTSSIAHKVASNSEALKQLIDNIDPELLATAIAKEIVRGDTNGYHNRNAGYAMLIKNIQDRVAKKLEDQITKDITLS